MNLQQIEYIVAVDQYKSFSKAAEHCHITQATLSAMVKKLEEELGTVIFDRKVNPVITTDCGKELLREARLIVHHTQQLRELAKTVRQTIEGEVRIGIIPTIANSLLPRVLKPIMEKYPHLELRISESTTADIVQHLKEGSLDMGLLVTPLNMPEMEENILYYESLMIYGDATAGREYLFPEDLRDYKIWLWEQGHCLREQMVNLCHLKRNEHFPANLSFEANSFETLLNMVDTFGGLTIIPELYFQSLPPERRQKVSRFHAPYPVREVSLAYYRPFARLRLIQALTDEIRALISPALATSSQRKDELMIVQV